MPALKNARQEKYVQNLIKGMTQRQAYRDAFPDSVNTTDKSVDELASRLFNDVKVHTRYEELLKELEDETILSVKERMKWLSEVVKDIQKEECKIKMPNGKEEVVASKNADINTKIKAIDTLNKMDNAYQQNINVNGNIERIRIVNNLDE